jgi:hypothetical protein
MGYLVPVARRCVVLIVSIVGLSGVLLLRSLIGSRS